MAVVDVPVFHPCVEMFGVPKLDRGKQREGGKERKGRGRVKRERNEQREGKSRRREKGRIKG